MLRLKQRKKERHAKQYGQVMQEYLAIKYPDIEKEIKELYNRIAPLYPGRKNLTKTVEFKVRKKRQNINVSVEAPEVRMDTSEALNEVHTSTNHVYEDEDIGIEASNSNMPVEELLMQPSIAIPLLQPTEVRRVLEEQSNPMEQAMDGINLDDVLNIDNLDNIDNIVDEIIRELEGRTDEGIELDFQQEGENIFW